VLLLVAQGKPDKVIAAELGISVHTVNAHLRKAYRKFGVHSRVELVVRCFHHLNR
jgi:DNA-binding CsgD family transcriptional regulator